MNIFSILEADKRRREREAERLSVLDNIYYDPVYTSESDNQDLYLCRSLKNYEKFHPTLTGTYDLKLMFPTRNVTLDSIGLTTKDFGSLCSTAATVRAYLQSCMEVVKREAVGARFDTPSKLISKYCGKVQVAELLGSIEELLSNPAFSKTTGYRSFIMGKEDRMNTEAVFDQHILKDGI